MGCDIHISCEKYIDGKWQGVCKDFKPFDWRSYGMFGFLANVRNYSYVPCISEPRGTPQDSPRCIDDFDRHSASYLTVQELLDFNYDQMFEDRRCTKETSPNVFNGAADSGIGHGTWTSIRDFLSQAFFDDLNKLKELGVERIVFDFDC